MFVGATVGLVATTIWPGLAAAVGVSGAILWGAAIGVVLASLPQFAAAGKIVTRSENRALNLAVGFGIPAAALLGLALFLGWQRNR